MIAKCDCINEFQDIRYGKGNRVHNSTTKFKIRCVVCGKEQSPKEQENKKKA